MNWRGRGVTLRYCPRICLEKMRKTTKENPQSGQSMFWARFEPGIFRKHARIITAWTDPIGHFLFNYFFSLSSWVCLSLCVTPACCLILQYILVAIWRWPPLIPLTLLIWFSTAWLDGIYLHSVRFPGNPFTSHIVALFCLSPATQKPERNSGHGCLPSYNRFEFPLTANCLQKCRSFWK